MNEITPPQLASAPNLAASSGRAAPSPIDSFFRLTERGTSVGREMIAGFTAMM